MAVLLLSGGGENRAAQKQAGMVPPCGFPLLPCVPSNHKPHTFIDEPLLVSSTKIFFI